MITQHELKELLRYDPDTGVFTWLENRGKAHIGMIAGSPQTQGYTTIRVNRKPYLAHRLAWFYTYNDWPDEIDHINHVKTDNRLCNLRGVDRAENSKNQSLKTNNTSGITGVGFEKRRGTWRVRINHNKKEIHIGEFRKLRDAIAARKDAEVRYGYHDNHGDKKKGA